MEKGLFIPHFLGGNITIFGNVSKNGYIYVAIFGNISKNGYVTEMTTVCPTDVYKSRNFTISGFFSVPVNLFLAAL